MWLSFVVVVRLILSVLSVVRAVVVSVCVRDVSTCVLVGVGCFTFVGSIVFSILRIVFVFVILGGSWGSFWFHSCSASVGIINAGGIAVAGVFLVFLVLVVELFVRWFIRTGISSFRRVTIRMVRHG